jgi:hypothetical protein
MCFLLARDQRARAQMTRALLVEQMLHCVAFSLFEDVGSRQGGSRPKESNIVVPRDSRNILRTAFYVCHTLSGNYWVHCGELFYEILQIKLLKEKMVAQKWYLIIA